MTAQTRTVNKGVFEQGDQPQGSNYADLIDSYVAIADTTVQSLSSDLIVPILTVTTEVSAPLIRVTTVSAATGYFDTINAGAAIFSGSIQVSATATFEGPVKGPSGVGLMELVQRVTVADQNSAGNPVAVNLPSGADVTDITFLVEITFTASASAQTGEFVIYLGSGDATAASIISETRVSATGAYDCLDILSGATTLEPSRLRNVTSTVHAFLTAKNIATAFTGGGQGMLQVRYVHNA